jgi:hypothetical protein
MPATELSREEAQRAIAELDALRARMLDASIYGEGIASMRAQTVAVLSLFAGEHQIPGSITADHATARYEGVRAEMLARLEAAAAQGGDRAS